MKKIAACALSFVILFILAPPVHAEKIDTFSDSITVNKDGTVTVSENIRYDFEGVFRHGIFRTIPTIKTNKDGKKFRLEYGSLSVVDEKGKPYAFTKSFTGNADDLQLKIGDAGRTVTGIHTYMISYVVKGALTYFSDHDELYWNVTGNNWEVPVHTAGAELILPPTTGNVKLACYTGLSGNTAANCTASYTGGKADIKSAVSLSPAEGLTIVAGFPKNLAAVVEPKEVVSFWDTDAGAITGGIIVLFASVFFLFWYLFFPLKIIYKWYRYGRDPATPTGVASSWYDPPKTKDLRLLTPGETGALIDERADNRDISATIVDLARRGFLKIAEKDKNDFYLTKTKNFQKDKTLQPFEKILLTGIFESEDSLRIKDADLVDTVKDTKESIYGSLVTDGFFDENPEKVRKFYYIIAVLALCSLNIPLAFIAFIFGTNMPRKTLFGAGAANVGRSLKNFLVSQDRQLEFQARNQLFFERLLPFAVAFGVEKIWAQRFKDIAMKPPSWYQGYGHNTFTSYYLINSLNSSFSSFTAAATPTSSSSGFSSGFSGGSSGGGGGGGGGGSW